LQPDLHLQVYAEGGAGGWNGIQTCTLVPTPAADLSIA
jgi:hypothetical protein